MDRLRHWLRHRFLQRAACRCKIICENVLALKWRCGAVVSEFGSEIVDSDQADWLDSWLAAQRNCWSLCHLLIEQMMKLHQKETSFIVEHQRTRGWMVRLKAGLLSAPNCDQSLNVSESNKLLGTETNRKEDLRPESWQTRLQERV